MLLESLTAQRLESAFPERFYQRGKDYYHKKRVCDLQVVYRSNKSERITAVVNGSEPYAVRVELGGPLNKIRIHGTCECPIAINCKHVIATLLQAINKPDISQKENVKLSFSSSYQPKQVMPAGMESHNHAMEHWLDSLERSLSAPMLPENKVDESHVLLYQLATRPYYSPDIRIQLVLVKRLKKGGFGTPKKFNESSYAQSKHLTSIDKAIIAKLEVHNKLHGRLFYNDYVLKEESGELIFTDIISTGRVCLLSSQNKVYQQGPKRFGAITWEIDADGFQQARFSADGQTLNVFFIHHFWYIDNEKEVAGMLESNLDVHIANRIMSAPKIPPEYIQKVTTLLNQHEKMREVTPPRLFDSIENQKGNPIPCLYLSQATIRFQDGPYTYAERVMPIMTLSFDYGGIKIPWTYEPGQITQTTDRKITRILRDKDKEVDAIDELECTEAMLIRMIPGLEIANKRLADVFYLDTEHGCNPLDFSLHDIPELERMGFRVEMADDYPYRIINDPIDEWYSTIEESSGVDWFGLELGVTIKGEKINLLPVLQKLVPQLRMLNKNEINQMQSVMVQLPDRRYLALSAERIRHITNVLVELYDSDSLSNENQLRLSKWHAARLLDLEKACGASNLRWIGGDRLRLLGAKLASFKGIQSIKPANEFKGQLRCYQQEGLSWLQFLREYELGGILADDMGLGKTVQAIAHIQLEKVSGRMQCPALVVAPTSLMFNWCAELERFSPHLKVLMLHGPKRVYQFGQINDYDLILTTYPLLVRDKDVLLKQPFYFFILDEAQFIKNAKSQVAQVAMQVKATHRLCLTGTPMENHLGELWSLFHFMMPGFLGSEATFHRLFRTPIEKHGDHERRLHLNKRIAPFLLRRTKDKVVKELPDKVEMVRHAELDGAQRDLYETIRVTMHKKVRQEIAKAGMARSHIIILDALLKLRQVCCDPRLLKIAVKGKTYQSAKSELLMALLKELLEEGRRILIFSQFAEMLGLIEQELEKRHIAYVKLTGKTKDRQTPIQSFQAGEVPVFLISLKAGGTGLNLTVADTVIHYDPWWNPAVENQATDRAHRIGQNKTVFVYKLIAKGTVEEKMLEMQQKKSALMQSLFSEAQTTGLKLSEQDLQGLFEPLE